MVARRIWLKRELFSRASTFTLEFSDLIRFGSLGLLICIIGDLIAGIELGSLGNFLELIPGLIILVPPAMGMRGNVYGALASRLGTSMQTGTFTPSLQRDSLLSRNVIASCLLTIFVSVILGIVAKLVSLVFGLANIPLSGFILISFLAGIISASILIPIVIIISKVGYFGGWDIDNFSAPVITATGDIITIPSLYIAAIVMIRISAISDMILNWLAVLVVLIAFLLFIFGIKEKGITGQIFRESIPILVFTSFVGAFGGFIIDTRLESLIDIAAILVLIPPFLGVNNALGGILSARLSSMLHLGVIYPSKFPERAARRNFTAMYLFAIVVFPLVGASSHLLSEMLGFASPGAVQMIMMSFIAGLASTTMVNIIAYLVASGTFKLGADPDIHSIPVTSSMMDLFGIFSLMLTLALF
ncbi:MAG: magnesium transporter [Candidatus Syntrophoarchaeum sp.]|nr:magnesium transporter [Candidatus Syntrophoarchaeum sp.]